MSDVFIQATETDPAVRAATEVRGVHRRLLERLAALAEHEPGQAHAVLTGFLEGELRRHLAAADEALYAPASGAPETRLLVRALRATAAEIEALAGAVASAADPVRASRDLAA